MLKQGRVLKQNVLKRNQFGLYVFIINRLYTSPNPAFHNMTKNMLRAHFVHLKVKHRLAETLLRSLEKMIIEMPRQFGYDQYTCTKPPT